MVSLFNYLFCMKYFFWFLFLTGINATAQINPSNITIARDSLGVP